MKLDNFYVDDKMVSKALMSSIDDYIYLGDLTTNVFFVSQNMYDDFDLPGRLVEDLVNVWGKLIHEKDKERYFKSIDDMPVSYTHLDSMTFGLITVNGLSGKSKSSSTANVDPLFSLLLTVIVPPIKVTRFLAIDMPKPVPPYF